jgi:hypothetical protein
MENSEPNKISLSKVMIRIPWNVYQRLLERAAREHRKPAQMAAHLVRCGLDVEPAESVNVI